MLTENPMRFLTDVFGLTTEKPADDDDSGTQTEPVASFVKTALLVSKEPIDLTGYTSVDGFAITGTVDDNCNRRFMWKIDGKVYKFTNGEATEYTKKITASNVLKDGNVSGALHSLASVPFFAGKKVYPIIALSASSEKESLPTCLLRIKATSTKDVLSKTFTSAIYPLTEDEGATPMIISCTPDITTKGSGSLKLKIRLRETLDDSSWTSYMDLNEAVDRSATAVQVQGAYTVTKTDGTDSVRLNSVIVEHTLGRALVSSGTADIMSTVADYDNDLNMCYTVVKHEPIKDATLDAYVNFMQPPKTRQVIPIGTGNGNRLEFVLGVDGVADKRIDTSSVIIYQNGIEIQNYSINSATSTVTINTQKNIPYHASYDYDHGVEQWRKMTLEEQEPINDGSGIVSSRFSYVLDDNKNMTVANVRLHMVRKSGTTTDASLPVATGKMQMTVLKHNAKPSTINITNSKQDWSYDADSNILCYTATKGTSPTLSYKWKGDDIIIYSWVTGFACA